MERDDVRKKIRADHPAEVPADPGRQGAFRASRWRPTGWAESVDSSSSHSFKARELLCSVVVTRAAAHKAAR